MVELHGSIESDASSKRMAALIEQALVTVTAYQNRMAGLLFEISCLDGLEKLAAAGRLPMAFRVHMQRVMALFDQSARVALRQLRDAGFIGRCKLGCSHCCHQMPTGVSSAELIMIYHGMQRSRVASRLFRRCLEAEELWVEICHRQGPQTALQSRGPSTVETLSKIYSRLEHPCPFLEADLCQIYPFRPLACRMHFSFSPPSWCRTSHFQNPHALSFNLEPGRCFSNTLDNLDERFRLDLSDVMIGGLLELTVNVMRFDKIRWER